MESFKWVNHFQDCCSEIFFLPLSKVTDYTGSSLINISSLISDIYERVQEAIEYYVREFITKVTPKYILVKNYVINIEWHLHVRHRELILIHLVKLLTHSPPVSFDLYRDMFENLFAYGMINILKCHICFAVLKFKWFRMNWLCVCRITPSDISPTLIYVWVYICYMLIYAYKI